MSEFPNSHFNHPEKAQPLSIHRKVPLVVKSIGKRLGEHNSEGAFRASIDFGMDDLQFSSNERHLHAGMSKIFAPFKPVFLDVGDDQMRAESHVFFVETVLRDIQNPHSENHFVKASFVARTPFEPDKIEQEQDTHLQFFSPHYYHMPGWSDSITDTLQGLEGVTSQAVFSALYDAERLQVENGREEASNFLGRIAGQNTFGHWL